ncbi:MAG: fructosamine kinase family protein [Flavobacteriia bacterium]|nr:fructosamine kinase family protein [Flavobacteriia bacterium]
MLTPLSGGDIHSVFSFELEGTKYAIKVNDAMPSDVFEKEAAGLKALAECPALNVPKVLQEGSHNEVDFLLLEYIENGTGAVDFEFGDHLAELHKMTSSSFGWESDNYIGSLPQVNTPTPSWQEFFVEYRLNVRVKELRDAGAVSRADISIFDSLAARFEERIPKESPSFLHGDLWSGNALVDNSGQTWLIDPAVYYGHREMDLAMMKLFGGFSEGVFRAYNERFPLEPEWKSRVQLNQLYPMLVHAVLFGGHYVRSSVDIARTYS